MIINKSERKILNYIYKKKTASFKKLSSKFQKCPDFQDMLYLLIYHHFVIQIGGSHNEYGEPIPFTMETKFQLDRLGYAEVESHQWFNGQFVLLQIVLPIVIAVITTLITIFLSA